MQEQMQRIEQLVQELESIPDRSLRHQMTELVRSIMQIHADALDRMMEIVAESGEADTVFNHFAGDHLVAHVLLLHGLHPVDIRTRIEGALESVRPYLKSHGGDVHLLSIMSGAVRLRMTGTCDGCPASAVTLKTAIEKAIYEAAPDVVSILCEPEEEEHGTTAKVSVS